MADETIPTGTDETTLEIRKKMASERYASDVEQLEQIRANGPSAVGVRLLLNRFRYQDPEWPTPLEVAAVNAFREEFKELLPYYDKFVADQSCRDKPKLFQACIAEAERLQKVVDSVFGANTFKVAAAGAVQIHRLAGTAVIIDPTPEAYAAQMAVYNGRQRRQAPYAGVVVKDIVVNGEPKWALLFY